MYIACYCYCDISELIKHFLHGQALWIRWTNWRTNESVLMRLGLKESLL